MQLCSCGTGMTKRSRGNEVTAGHRCNMCVFIVKKKSDKMDESNGRAGVQQKFTIQPSYDHIPAVSYH